MTKNFLLRTLVFPLLGIAAMLMFVSGCLPDRWSRLSVSLAAGMIGSLVTVFYVQRILRSDEQIQWEKVRGHVGKQVNILANGTISAFRLALDGDLPASLENTEVATNPRKLRRAMLDYIETVLLPGVSGLRNMDQEHWRIFAMNMAGSVHAAERLISLFSRHLDATVVGLILDTYEEARALHAHYEVWPDKLGIPLDQLPPNNRGESSVPFFEAEYKLIVHDALKLLKTCADLLREIDTRFPEAK